uniref:DNA repair and recombination protein RAD54-like n=1 Tax=Panagrellus redivivus TaxID=6233 RepID=A0A7E4VA18_PANRE
MKRYSDPVKPALPVKPEVVETYEILYAKVSGRKHKKWENDGFLFISDKRRFRLKNSDGETQAIGMIDLAEYTKIADCEELVLGRFDVQVQQLMTEPIPPPKKPSPIAPKYNVKSYLPSPSAKRAKYKEPYFNEDPPPKPDSSKAKSAVKYFELRQPGEDGFHEGVKVSARISAKLRPHQEEGVRFLFNKLRHSPSGAILADEMGLGKTIQTVAVVHTMLNTKYQSRKLVNKALILCPLVLRDNWAAEFSKWVGSTNMCYIPQNSADLDRYWATSMRVPVCIINYDMVKSYAKQLRQIVFDVVVCDEAHVLKKVDGKIREIIESLNIPRRILLTGTPIQNKLRELYDLSLFVNPNMFVNFKDFVEQLNDKGAEVVSRFLLRRSCDINKEFLPPRHDYLIFCRPSELQIKVYDAVLEAITANSLTVLQALRHICNHPAFLYRNLTEGKFTELSRVLQAYPESFDMNSLQVCDSSKMRVLLRMVGSFRAAGDKTVIVSSYTTTLDLIQVLLKSVKFSVCRLDGSLGAAVRYRLVNDFNAGNNPNEIFLLSSAAGGTGLNLIGANRLIMFDCSWNPAVDLQSMARIWRDGQTKDVYIYRLFTAGSIEEKILQRQIKKVGISTVVNPVAIYEETTEENIEFEDDVLEDLLTFEADTACQTHDLIACSCAEDGGNSTLDNPNYEVAEEPVEGEELLENEKHALDVVKELGIMKEEHKAPRASMAELFRWKHFGGDIKKFTTLAETVGINGTDEVEEVSFVMALEPQPSP